MFDLFHLWEECIFQLVKATNILYQIFIVNLNNFFEIAAKKSKFLYCCLCGPCLLLFTLLFSCSSSSFADDRSVLDGRIHFDIPTQKADIALTEFGRQANLSLLYQFDLVNQYTTNSLHGNYTLRSAIKQLLANTGLRAEFDPTGYLVIIPDLQFDQKKAVDIAEEATVRDFESTSNANDKKDKSQEFTLEEVVISARYRSENLQNSPLSITALSSSDLEARGIDSVTDISASVPNVSLAPGGARNGKAAVAYIRGVGQFDASFAYEPGIGVYVDDVYYQTLFGTQFTLGDVDNIQILRGPQGTLFGKNTEGGAVVVNMADPKGGDSGYIKVSHGSYNYWQFKGAFDTSLLEDELYMRIAYTSDKQDGYVDLIDYACVFPATSGNLMPMTKGDSCKAGTQGASDVQTARIALKWLPQDDLTVRFAADVMRDRGSGPPDVLVDIPLPDKIAQYNADTLIPTFGIPYDRRFLPPNKYVSYQSLANPLNNVSTPNVQTINSWGANLKVNWALGENTTFSSISAYRKLSGDSNYNAGQSPLPISYGYIDYRHNQYSQELKLSSVMADDHFEWTLGAYYSYGDSWLGGFYDVAMFGLDFALDDHSPKRNKSFFAHGLYHISDKWILETGIRYSDDWKKYTFRHTRLSNGELLFPVTSGVSDATHIDPKLGLQYQWTPEFMAYVQYGTGYKSGGINGHPNVSEDVVSFDAERLGAYEIGFKSQWFDNQLRLNLAAFYNDLKNLQLVIFVPGEAGGVQSNADHAVIKGVELEIEAEPIWGLLLNVGIGVLDFEYRDLGAAAYDPLNNPGGLRDNDMGAYSPEFKSFVSAQYTLDTDNYGRFTPQIDYTYQSKMYFDQQNVDFSSQDQYGILNARLFWDAFGRELSFTFEINNVFNKFYWLNMANLANNWGSLGGTPAMPRTYSMSVEKTF